MDYKDVDNTATDLARKSSVLDSQEGKFRFRIPQKLRFPLAWTIFFILIGIIVQSVQAGHFVFLSFFWDTYIAWIKSLGTFVDVTYYESRAALVYAMLNKSYYFFYTGGLLSVLWGIIYSLTHSEIN